MSLLTGSERVVMLRHDPVGGQGVAGAATAPDFPPETPCKAPTGQLAKQHLPANICRQMRQLSHNYFVSTL